MQWTAPTTGIWVPKCGAVAVRQESPCGYEQTWSRPNLKSALPPEADILRFTLDFRC